MRRFFVSPVLNFITLVRSVSTFFVGFFERIPANELRLGRLIASMTLIAGLFWQTLLIVSSQAVQEKRKNGGILPTGYVCDQLKEAINYLSNDADFSGHSYTPEVVIQNRGPGAYNRGTSHLTFLFQRGLTRFYTDPRLF